MRYYNSETPRIVFAGSHTKLAFAGFLCTVLGVALYVAGAGMAYNELPFIDFSGLGLFLSRFSLLFLASGCFMFTLALVLRSALPDTVRIKYYVRRGLLAPQYGNPLHLRNGELLPVIRCVKGKIQGQYIISVSALPATTDDILAVASSVSACLCGRYENYAVIQMEADMAANSAAFIIADVTVDRTLHFNDVNEMKSANVTQLAIADGIYLDLTKTGSMLFCGKTRSGKTTGLIALLLQILLHGRDKHGSEITVIDPKMAELSACSPYVVTLDNYGEATQILDSMQKFADTVLQRQRHLNELSKQAGDAVKWWDAGFHPSVLFIDEYVSLRSMLPTKADKERPNYSLAAFDGLLRRIVTTGASAGCFVAISIAEASVESAGLPAMLRAAMSTRFLFKPTEDEGRLLWDSEKLKSLPNRIYSAGDCWFSSDDGVNNFPAYVHFPQMEFPVYRELGGLLALYYSHKPSRAAPRN